MTRAQFLAEFKSALERPDVTIERGTALLRFVAAGVRMDPIGLVWWMRTGTAHPARLLDGLAYGVSLGMTTEDALDLLDAADGHLGAAVGSPSRRWREGLDGIVIDVTSGA